MNIAMLLHKAVVHDARVRREARALSELGHRVTVLELDQDAAGHLDGFARRSAAPPAWVRRRLPFQLYRAVFLLWFVRRLLQLRPDVVHAHDAAMLLPGLIGARLVGAKLVYDSHELATGVPYRDGGWALFVRLIERVAVPRASAVVTVSNGIAERLQTLYGLRDLPTVVRNVTELRPPEATGSALRVRLGIGKGVPLVLHQGAPAPDRGGEQLIEAMQHVADAHLVFLGSSPFVGYEDGLRRQAAAAGLDDRVHFLASVPLDRLLEHTADAAIGVSLLQDTCDNHRLALPNKVFEYLTAGVPVVVSDLPEVAALVHEHGVGWTAQPHDPHDVARALRAALEGREDPALRERVRAAAAELHWNHERERLRETYALLAFPASRRALILVRNNVTHDARVLREVDTLARAGWRPVVVGVVSTEVTERRGRLDGAPLLRLDPRSPLRRIRERFPRSTPVEAPLATRGAVTSLVPLPPRAAAPHALVRLHRTLTALDFYRKALGAVRTLRPQLLHCNDWNTMWVGVAAKFLWRTPVVYDAHELWADRNGRSEPRPWLVAAEALFVRVADEVITTSPGYAEEIARRYRTRSPRLVRNLPTSVVVPAAKRDGGPPILAYAGGLLRGRGLEQAIEVLAHIADVRLVLIGPGRDDYVEELRRLAVYFGVDRRLEVRGAVAPGAVVGALAGADAGLCLIQPVCRSYELTLPNKLFEYAAAGVPILASDLPVIAATVRLWDAGVVVPPADVPAIADGLRTLLTPEARVRLQAGARRLARDARWDQEREVLAAVYERAAGPPPSGLGTSHAGGR